MTTNNMSAKSGMNMYIRSTAGQRAMNSLPKPLQKSYANKGVVRSAKDLGYYSNGKAPLPLYKKGGKVKKTGMAIVHKGEMVVPKKKGTKMPTLAQIQKSISKTKGYK